MRRARESVSYTPSKCPNRTVQSLFIAPPVGYILYFRVDLFVKERPNACRNFLKLCKVKYYNLCQFYRIEVTAWRNVALANLHFSDELHCADRGPAEHRAWWRVDLWVSE